MTDSGFNQSFSQLGAGSYSNTISGIETTYSYPINLYRSYIITPTLSTLSSVFVLIDRSLIRKGIDIISSGHPSLGKDGVTAFSSKVVDGAIVFDHKAWSTIQVPSSSPLPYVEGEPTV
jgi:hypothetical protein